MDDGNRLNDPACWGVLNTAKVGVCTVIPAIAEAYTPPWLAALSH